MADVMTLMIEPMRSVMELVTDGMLQVGQVLAED